MRHCASALSLSRWNFGGVNNLNGIFPYPYFFLLLNLFPLTLTFPLVLFAGWGGRGGGRRGVNPFFVFPRYATSCCFPDLLELLRRPNMAQEVVAVLSWGNNERTNENNKNSVTIRNNNVNNQKELWPLSLFPVVTLPKSKTTTDEWQDECDE